jgi:hypothetical protein
MAKAIYWGSIEYLYNSKHSEYPKLKGGFVHAFYYTDDVRKYLTVVQESLEILNLDIVRVEFVNMYDLDTQWEDESYTKIYKQISRLAKSSKKVVFDDFYAYKSNIR